ncbi:ATP synthase F1 subunit delta [Compostibacter hankyongensis]|uniref:ATP synthase subunit delta n=1 Tax=Compostibacter hankyongensis TaxID=1007089 RepID=A0ABP8FF00_9BACT
MQNPRLASRYAKSLIDMAIETNQLEAVYWDMQLLQAVCKSNPDFTALLRSPIIKADKKEKIFRAIFGDRLTLLSAKFSELLMQKGRELFLPEIAGAVIRQYQQIQHIRKIKITTAVAVDDSLKADIVKHIRAETPLDKVDLEAEVDDSLIGGFVLEMENTLFDASILRDLKDIRQQFDKNVYVRNIR